MHLGAQMNAALMGCVIGLMTLGGLTGLVTSAERRLPARIGAGLRMGWKRAHIALFLPIPVLVLFHVLAVYYY